MGQSQLLMIVLGVIIVGIAVAVGISQMGESALSANHDAVAQDNLRIVSQAQAWYRKPTSLGGGGSSFTGFTLAKAGMDSTNANGTYSVSVASDGTNLTITGTGTELTSGGSTVEVVTSYYAANDSTSTTDNM